LLSHPFDILGSNRQSFALLPECVQHVKTIGDRGIGLLHRFLWFIGTARNAVVVILAGLFAYGLLESKTVAACEKKGAFDKCVLHTGLARTMRSLPMTWPAPGILRGTTGPA
jgi:hypothetical protein